MGLISSWKYPWLPTFRLKFSNLSNLFLKLSKLGVNNKNTVLIWRQHHNFQALCLLKRYTRSKKILLQTSKKIMMFISYRKLTFDILRMTNSLLFNSSHQGKHGQVPRPPCWWSGNLTTWILNLSSWQCLGSLQYPITSYVKSGLEKNIEKYLTTYNVFFNYC